MVATNTQFASCTCLHEHSFCKVYLPPQTFSLQVVTVSTNIHFTSCNCLHKHSVYKLYLPLQTFTLQVVSSSTNIHFTSCTCLYKHSFYKLYLPLQTIFLQLYMDSYDSLSDILSSCSSSLQPRPEQPSLNDRLPRTQANTCHRGVYVVTTLSPQQCSLIKTETSFGCAWSGKVTVGCAVQTKIRMSQQIN